MPAWSCLPCAGRHQGGRHYCASNTTPATIKAQPSTRAAEAFFLNMKKQATVARSEERRVGKEGVSTYRSRWSPSHEKKNNRKLSNSKTIEVKQIDYAYKSR